MNREILFKAKGIEEYDKDKWYYGYYVKLDKTTYCFKEDYDRNPNNSEHKILFDVMTDWGLPNQHKMADINIDTLCQYITTTINNIRIFTGDILRFTEKTDEEDIVTDYEVYFNENMLSYYAKSKTDDIPLSDLLYSVAFNTDRFNIEVVGNIHDNQ